MQDIDVASVQINFFCNDVRRSAAFFEALGMRRAFIYPPTGEPSKIEVEAAGVRIGFDAIPVANEIAGLGVEPATGGRSAEVALWVGDVDDVYAVALSAGGQVLRPPMDSPDGRLRFAWLLDPEGHQVRLLQRR